MQCQGIGKQDWLSGEAWLEESVGDRRFKSGDVTSNARELDR
jgi:hypothetical protein